MKAIFKWTNLMKKLKWFVLCVMKFTHNKLWTSFITQTVFIVHSICSNEKETQRTENIHEWKRKNRFKCIIGWLKFHRSIRIEIWITNISNVFQTKIPPHSHCSLWPLLVFIKTVFDQPIQMIASIKLNSNTAAGYSSSMNPFKNNRNCWNQSSWNYECPMPSA